MTIREARRKKGYTMKKVARILDIPYTTYMNYDRGERRVPAKIGFRIAELLDMPIKDVFGIED